MKKLIPAFMTMVLAISFGSCRKVYTCTCTDGGSVKNVREMDKGKKKDAQAACNALSGPTLIGTKTVTLKCSL
jgi:hypothetical protein